MFPDQLRKALEENWPVVLPYGVLEYHGEHSCLGVDTLVITGALEILEKEMDIVVLPAYFYGAGSYAVVPPEKNGTVHVDSEVILPFARDLFKSLLRIGFKNIHVFIHHQSENFHSGMPNDLALRLAAKQVLFELLRESKGEGWWGRNDAGHFEGESPFNWIQVHPFMADEVQQQFPGDHAGRHETSLMMAFCPEGIDMSRYSDKQWFVKSAKDANMEYANEVKQAILDSMRKVLRG